ncbi:MAG: hypothetical protein HY912_08020 [Desulfomonile tiedjei]|uniref:Uncharacterized protein n=1 Tax=Desulfomonile tiedjei TaxID=2358 RepID=A0A9D6UZR5_9BACT|nr:hypothetical protein [Desulfomonile tiedjei]
MPINLMKRFEYVATIAAVIAILGIAVLPSAATAAQTREQCYDCCKGQGHDEYYLEQCRLKCFRNNDHCLEQQKRQPAAEVMPPSSQPQPAPARPAPERQVAEKEPPAAPQFRWPNPLNLVPGKEWEAAGQILAVNGVSPQHPQYPAALKAVEQVLVQFARANPSGGRLPTAQLERILRLLR